MAATARAYLVPGAVTRSVWCEVHSIPHILEYKVYRVVESGPGNLSIFELKDVRRCDLR